MYSYIAGVTCISTIKPYIRKNLNDCLDCYDYLYINTFIITTFVLLLMLYTLFFDEEKSIQRSMNKYKNLNSTQIVMLIFMAIVTLSSSIFLYKLEANYKKPFLHNTYLRILSILFLLIASYISFERSFNIRHLFGIFSIIMGVYILNYK